MYLTVRLWCTIVVVRIPRLLAVVVVSLKNYAALVLMYMSDIKINNVALARI